MKVSITGTVAVGKSYFLEKIVERYSQFKPIFEPIHLWENLSGTNLLKSFYENPKKFAFRFQVWALLTLQDLNKGLSENQIYLQERGVCSCKIFADLLFENDILEEDEYYIFNSLFDSIDIPRSRPDLYIYLHDSTLNCHERMLQRGRVSEQNISLNYLEKVKAIHDALFLGKSSFHNIPVLSIHFFKGMTQDVLNQNLDIVADFIFKNKVI